MSEKTVKMIRIKWVRSGIGFTRRQKTIVRSLGLYKLNHSVVRPDTPQIRGIVAAVPHLLEIVPEPVTAAWASIPEYAVHAAAAVAPGEPSSATEAAAEPEAASEPEPEAAEASAVQEEKSARAVRAKKRATAKSKAEEDEKE